MPGTLTRVGSLPVSALNIGLAGSLPALNAEAAAIQVDLSNVALNITSQASVALEIPDLATLTAAVGAELNPLEVAAQYVGMFTAGADLNAELLIEFGLISAEISLVQGIAASISLGLNSDGISGWTYTGRPDRFGRELSRDTVTGFATVAANENIRAVIIGTESFASWRSFSEGMNTGGTANAEAEAGSANLNFLGTLGAVDWNTGTASIAARIELYLSLLRGARLAIEASIEASVGIGLPAPQVLVDAGLEVTAELGIDGLLENILNANVDFGADISGLELKLQLLLKLIGDIGVQLSAGGLMMWVYDGPANGIGEALEAELVDGIPNGTGRAATVYGLVLAGAPTDMLGFGSIFKTAA